MFQEDVYESEKEFDSESYDEILPHTSEAMIATNEGCADPDLPGFAKFNLVTCKDELKNCAERYCHYIESKKLGYLYHFNIKIYVNSVSCFL